jgi:hypothetical protein
LKQVASEKGKAIDAMTDEDKKEAQERYLAVAFILGSDRSRFGLLIEHLENAYLQGQNGYPKTVTGAYHLLTNWKQERQTMPTSGGNHGVAFANVEEDQQEAEALVNAGQAKRMGNNARSGGATTKQDQTNNPKAGAGEVKCHRCGKIGHYANDCPAEGDQG